MSVSLLLEGQVGPKIAKDGQPTQARLDNEGALCVTQAHGGYTEASWRRNLFLAQAIVTSPVIYTTAAGTGGPLFFNPPMSNFYVSFKKVGFAISTASGVAGSLGFSMYTHGYNTPASTTAIDGIANLCTGGPPPMCHVYRTGTAIVSNDTSRRVFVPLASVGTGATNLWPGFTQWLDLDGIATLPPGYTWSICASATLTSCVVTVSVIWEEDLPISDTPFPWPEGGVDLSKGFDAQKPETTPVGVNVRTFEPLVGRGRGGTWSGLSRYLPVRATSGVIQDLNIMVHTTEAALEIVRVVPVSPGYARASWSVVQPTIDPDTDFSNHTEMSVAATANWSVRAPSVTAPGSAPARVQTAKNSTTGFTLDVTWGATTTTSNLLVAVVAASDTFGATLTVTPPAGWTVAKEDQSIGANAGRYIGIFYIENAASQTTTGTWTTTGIRGLVVIAMEYAGCTETGALDKTQATSGSSTSPITGTTATTTQADEILVGGLMAENDTFSSPTNSFSIVDQATLGAVKACGCALDLVVSSTSTYSTGATIGTSQAWRGAIATFKGA